MRSSVLYISLLASLLSSCSNLRGSREPEGAGAGIPIHASAGRVFSPERCVRRSRTRTFCCCMNRSTGSTARNGRPSCGSSVNGNASAGGSRVLIFGASLVHRWPHVPALPSAMASRLSNILSGHSLGFCTVADDFEAVRASPITKWRTSMDVVASNACSAAIRLDTAML